MAPTRRGGTHPRGRVVTVQDPYRVLQVDPEADDEAIRAAYKRLARMYHPDVSPDPASMARMVSINQAWEILRDPIRRAAADRARTRNAGTTARAAAAEGRAQAATNARRKQDAAERAAAGKAKPRGGVQADWPFAGMQDVGAGTFGPGDEPVASNWTPGRSTEGSRYDGRSMGAGNAGAPPGNPSGSRVTFGRYDGWTLGEIARRDLEYLEWLDRMPIGRPYQAEIDALLRKHGRRSRAPEPSDQRRGLFRRR